MLTMASGRSDLMEQHNLLILVREAQARARNLMMRLQEAMKSARVAVPPSPGAGEWVGNMTYEHPLQQLWARLVTAPGT